MRSEPLKSVQETGPPEGRTRRGAQGLPHTEKKEKKTRLQAWLASAASAEGLCIISKGALEDGPNAGGGTQGPDVRLGTRTGTDRGSYCMNTGE